MTINQRETLARHRRLLRALGDHLRRAREDAGRSQRSVAMAAGVSQSHLSAIEAGEADPSVEVLGRVGAALGEDLSITYFANTGPRIRDRHQATMEEVFLGMLSRRWQPEPEARVYRPVNGVIDLVLHDRDGRDSVATEVHSQLLRVEQQIRWAGQKADALAARPENAHRRIHRLLLLRNTGANRALVNALPRVIAAAYPARCADAFDALENDTSPFPGSALVWVDLSGTGRVLRYPPRGVQVGR